MCRQSALMWFVASTTVLVAGLLGSNEMTQFLAFAAADDRRYG